MTAADVLAAAVTAQRVHQEDRTCQFCANGFHARCVGVYTTPSGDHGCVCAYSWRHAEGPA